MYSEISACPCHPLVRLTSHLLLQLPLQLYRPSLKPLPRLFLRPCRFCLTIHPLLDRHPRSYYPSSLKRARAHRQASFSRFRHFFPRASDEPRRARKRNRVRETVWLDCKLDLHYFRFFRFPSPSLSLFLSCEPARSIYVAISRTGAF